MTFYENEDNKNIDIVSDDEGYFVVHWNYHRALEKLNDLQKQYDWMVNYIYRVKKKEDNKFFVLNGDADEISQMMFDIKNKLKEIHELFLR